MADLPDLPTSNISFVAYYNVEDQGGLTADWSPDEVLSHASIANYTLYDNGVEGEYTLQNGRNATFRVKSDGWFIGYLDRTYNHDGYDGNRHNWYGPYDIANWSSASTWAPADGDQHELERLIYNLIQQLSNSTGVSYSSSDVGLFNYEHPEATGTTILSDNEARSGYMKNSQHTAKFSRTVGTTLHFAAAAGSAVAPRYNGSYSQHARFKVSGTHVVHAGRSKHHHGALDLIYRDLIPDEGTEYDAFYRCYSGRGSNVKRSKGTVVLAWS